MFNRVRFWIIGKLVGDSSYIKNCMVEGFLGVRPDHLITCCFFSKDSKLKIGAETIYAVEAFK